MANIETLLVAREIKRILPCVHTVVIDRENYTPSRIVLITAEGELSISAGYTKSLKIETDAIVEALRLEKEALNNLAKSRVETAPVPEPADMTE